MALMAQLRPHNYGLIVTGAYLTRLTTATVIRGEAYYSTSHRRFFDKTAHPNTGTAGHALMSSGNRENRYPPEHQRLFLLT